MAAALTNKRAFALWVLFGLFICRVLGQLLVALNLAPFLPPMQEWFSGAIPYPSLLFSQIIIILLFGKVCLDFTRGRGFFVVRHRKFGIGFLVFGSIYFAVMVIRYGIRMSLYPHERWMDGSIPIFFHWILASFLLIVGAYHAAQSQRVNEHVSISTTKRWMIRIIWLIAGLLVVAALGLWIRFQLAPTILACKLGIRGPEFAVRAERGIKMPMSDGVDLVADIYHPQRISQTPTILIRIPLFKAMKPRLFANVIGRLWAERGYTVVIQGIRGHYGSGGVYYPLQGERKDGMDTLAWLARRPWFNGRVGMWGGSYFGYTQWVLADQVNPGPAALMVQLCSTDFHKMFYPGGAFSLESALYWAVWSASGKAESPLPNVLEPGYKGFPLIEADDRVEKDIRYFNDWVTHSERDSYWKAIDEEKRPESLVAPVLLMAGWYDPFLPTELNDFIRIKQGANEKVAASSRLIIGPWSHARNITFPGGQTTRNYRLETLAPSVAWFDEHLRNEPASLDKEAPVMIYVMGKNIWRKEQEWPVARAQNTPYYLHGKGVLSPSLPTSQELSDGYIYDPQNPVPSMGGAVMGARGGIALQNTVEDRQDVLSYTTSALEQDTEVTGPIALVLYVSTTAPSTDFTAKLVDVYPDGKAYNVTEGILRQSYKGVNQPTKIQIELWPTSMVFLKGHKIRLEVSSSNYPRFDRNPNTGGVIATETTSVTAKQDVYHDTASPSHLILPVIPNSKRGDM